MGNAHPSLFPYEPLPTADGELIVIAGNDGQFRKLCQVLDLPELPEDPRFGRNQDRTATVRSCARSLSNGSPPVPRTSGSACCSTPGAVRADQHDRRGRVVLAEELGLDPVVDVGGVPGVRNPITFSDTPARYALPPPGLDEHGEEIRAWLRAELPDLARHLRCGAHLAARAGPGRRPDGQGRVRRAGLLAGRPAPADAGRGAGVRGGAGRAGRSRLHPDGDRGPAHLPRPRPTRCRGRSRPDCSAAARGFSG